MKMDFGRVMGLMAAKFRDVRAIVNVERERSFTYAEYHLLTNKVANMMRSSLGLGKGDVAIAIVDNDNLILLHFPTIFKQEATFAFSNFRDSHTEHLWQVDLVKAKVAFLENKLVPLYHAELTERGCMIVAMDALKEEERLPGVLSFWDLLEGASDANPGIELDIHEHVPVLRFTGGTTGKGKCAMYSIDNFLGTRDAAYACRDFALGTDTRFIHLTPISHGSILFFWPTFFAGGTTYTLNFPDMDLWCQVVEREKITHGFLVPTLMYRLADAEAGKKYDLTSLKVLAYGAAPMAPARLTQLMEQFGTIFIQLYGATESIQFVTSLEKSDHVISDDRGVARLSSAGRVTPGVELLIAGEDGEELPANTTGEIRVRCRATIRGYFENPEASAKELVNGFWLSGDMGYLDEDGYLFIVDRKKDMIITGGFNVYAVEVEAALGEHAAVSASAVIGVPHPEWGEAVHAEVILRPGKSATSEELIAFAKQRLSYKAPKTICVVDALPVSAAGKVLRRVVREKYWDQSKRAVN
ncbi:MAG: long-chain fatty acid--CoA ligase [Hyphomicrobiales bacterium]|nr:MAG: long-chain fatty acid--CoA ligase [Hyphomicrobiales bacterium]